MVTFVCYYCDQTLKKKQLNNHQYQCQRPTKFICIDCKKTFIGGEHESHTNCMTEKEKYWGQYKDGVPGKQKPTQQQNNNNKNNNNNQQKQQQEEEEKKIVDTNENAKKEEKIEEQQVAKKRKLSKQSQNGEESVEFLGWKKEIRKVLKQQKEPVKIKQLKKTLVPLFLKANPESTEEQAVQIFEQKIQNPKYTIENKTITFA
ncbi:hypothetical protein PPERSA_05414 [Pseudocohnilembus persalinus]|uniref:Uncharacterized protein n=1 Tax=Pseudocohnilembus persalinus TaxID=266149 RepID=A0A0V0R7Z2_PSEPJ|nr:hypothetical protein PPERSA_05414 [Pseudocohnilembus persalinus]|eukprot:KRX10594.1 hypothetical protein PPERSA_05414 [Pseudocohnilembus persalinus]